MKTTIYLIIVCWIALFIIFQGQIRAEIRDMKTLQRIYEPIQLDAISMADTSQNAKFRDVPFNELFAFVYHADLGEWHQIPFQIDERGSDGKYFPNPDSKLYEKDEIVVMVKDLGDRVSENEWITDPDARLYPRYEVLVEDAQTGEKSWYYLYRSTSYQDTLTVDYVDRVTFSGNPHHIVSDIYFIGHTPDVVMNHLSYPETRGTPGTDLLDRQKVRLKGKAQYGVITLEYDYTEDALKKENTSYLDGRIRVIQKVDWKIEVKYLGTVVAEIPLDLTRRFNRNSIEIVGGQGNVSADMGVQLIRQSMDIDENFSGSRFYNPYNSGIMLNRVPDQNVDTRVDIPGVFWALITGEQGAFMQLIYLSSAIGETQKLYYCENSSGACDGTSDSGDKTSWGDIGLLLYNDVEGELSVVSNLFFFDEPVDADFGAQIATNFANPLTYETKMQNLDILPPAKSILVISDASDYSITWSWLAPGDDGTQNGPATLYEMRYDTKRPDNTDPASLLSWWNNATQVQNLPEPSNPFSFEKFEVTGLEREMTYFFLLRSKDHAGNYSDFSNIVSGTTTPVELLALSVLVESNQLVLNWQTASETNNYGFEIQRKYRNEDFEDIGFVEGAGTTNEHQSYSFIDTEIGPGEYWYRIKQIDTDGEFIFFSSVKVTIEGPQTFVLHQNYPNPFNLETTLKYEIPMIQQDSRVENSFDISLNIYNSLGQHIQTLVDERKRSGIYVVNWNGRDKLGQIVSSGVYFYQIIVRSADGASPVWSSVEKMLLLP